VKYFTEEYPWIFFNNKKIGCKICSKANFNLTKHQGTHGSQELMNGEICSVGDDFKKQQTNLRKNSQSHLHTERIIEKQKLEIMPTQVLKTSYIDIDNTKRIFRTAYSIAKNQRPYTDMPKLVDLQIINGLDMGRILQTNKAYSNIIDHITFEM